ncbi:MAG TPA: lipopolysaccharide heptosyltransferase II [Gemmatimonadales bacterium]|nr:lipopolysaccharide heptosyltransferase II [Gemmatimonadales bacterium]
MSVPISHLSPDILVVRFSAIGDILLTTPLLRAIRTRHPGARIAFLTKERFAPLLSDNPNLNEVIGIREEDGIGAIARAIRGVRYSHLLDLHGNLRTLGLRAMVRGPWRGFSKRRLERQVLISTKRDLYRSDLPMAERYFEAAADLDVDIDGEPPDFFVSPKAEARAERRLVALGVGPGRALVAIAPGAAHPTKCWPTDGWVRLVRRLLSTGAQVAIVGGPEDAEVAKAIVAGVRARLGSEEESRVASTAGLLGLQESGAVIMRAAALVSGDTGAMHMATGVGTPVVALFGPTVRQFGFFPYRAKRAAVVELPLDCRPCSAQGGPSCPLGHHRCLRAIAPDTVFDRLCAVLA